MEPLPGQLGEMRNDEAPARGDGVPIRGEGGFDEDGPVGEFDLLYALIGPMTVYVEGTLLGWIPQLQPRLRSRRDLGDTGTGDRRLEAYQGVPEAGSGDVVEVGQLDLERLDDTHPRDPAGELVVPLRKAAPDGFQVQVNRAGVNS